MTTNNRDDAALDALFRTAQDETPGEAFLERLYADADSATVIPTRAPTERGPRGETWLNWLMPTSGLAAATIAGIWIGIAVPEDGFDASSGDLDIAVFLPGPTLDGFSDWDGGE